jgi:uncharacterized protein YuzE
MLSRKIYFEDLLTDCIDAVESVEIPLDQRGEVIAALVLSDSYNGLRKSILQAEATRARP